MPDLLQLAELRRRANLQPDDASRDDELRDTVLAGLRYLKKQAGWPFWPRAEKTETIALRGSAESVSLPWPLAGDEDVISVTLDGAALAAERYAVAGRQLVCVSSSWSGSMLKVTALVGFDEATDDGDELVASLRTAARALFERDWFAVSVQLQSQGDEGGTSTYRDPNVQPAEVLRFLEIASFKHPPIG